MRTNAVSRRRAIGNRAASWPFRINRSSPQARGLQYWWPFIQSGEGRTIREMLRGAHATFDVAMDTGSWVSTLFAGRAVSFAGTPGDLSTVADEDGLSFPATDCAFSFWFRASAWGSNKGLVGKWTADQREYVFWTTTIDDQLEFLRRAGTSNAAATLTNAAFYDGTPTFVCGRTLANGDIDIAAWKPSLGLVKSTAVTPSQAFNTFGSAPLVFGSYDQGQAVEFACEIWDVRKYAVAPTDAELLSQVLPETRWSLYGRRLSRVWAVLSLGNIIAITAGAIATPGKAVVGSAKTIYQTVAGSVSLVGRTVVGSAHTVVSVVSGAVRATGQAVVGAAKTLLATITGALSVAGQNVVGAAGAVQSIIAGAVSSTGQFVQGAARTILSVLSGAVGATGQTVTVAVGNMLSVLKGAVGVVRKTVNISGSINTLVSSLTNGLVRSLRGDDI